MLVVASSLAGCATIPYEYGRDLRTDLTLPLRAAESQIERGRPHRLVDGIGHYLFSLPSKIILLDWRMNDHAIDQETEAALREYLDANDLCDVKVRLNEYAPGAEWSRLARNREMPAAWRWTLGLLSVTMYTILPERAFAGLIGGDHYNPYTNTISLYSNLRPVALHEAAHAKDFALKQNRHWKGAYAALGLLPIVPLWQEGVATGDALGWERIRGTGADERSAYRTLYPAYGTYIGGEAAEWAGWFGAQPWIYYAVAYGAVIPGHIVGQVRALSVDDRAPEEHTPPRACSARNDSPATDEPEKQP